MFRPTLYLTAGILLLLLVVSTLMPAINDRPDSPAHTVRVAVASNFMPTMTALGDRFEAGSNLRVVLCPGSTGSLYAQIVNGAPFDLFLAADTHRPRRLEADGMSRAGNRFTYAVGRLALWSPGATVANHTDVLSGGEFRALAIAHPKLAPYGQAARETLENLGLWAALQPRLVRGENIGQAFHFVQSGNAQLGLVALSQLKGINGDAYWVVPASLHEPIEQQAVLLHETPAARELWRFLQGDEARSLIQSFGYDLP